MSLRQYQDEVDGWLEQYDPKYWQPLSQLARLVEEVGEVARVLNHKYGEKPKKASEEPDDLEGELGDILFDVICLANSENIDLDEVLRKVMDKVQTRDKDRFPKKNPD
jgi:NTP pyrophosphatase (non-canonical NTP hydrolase)